MKKILLTALSITAASAGLNAQIILNADFQNGIPSGWTQTTVSTDGGWNAGNASSLSSSSFTLTEHGNFIATNDDACNCDKSADMLTTSTIDLSSYSGESVRLRFDLFFFEGTYQGATESFEVMGSTNGGSSWTSIYTATGAGDWQDAIIVDASSYAGNANVKFAFVFNDGAGWTWGAAIDNVVVEVPNEHDIKLVSVKVPPYSATDVPQKVRGVISNLGGSAENSITVSWTDGTITKTTTLAGTLNPGESMSFTHPDGIALASGTSISVDVTASVTGDADLSNNSLTGFSVDGVAFWPTKAVVGEEATGTWCGWCPRGMVGMEYMEENYEDQWIGIAVHNNDPMQNMDYDSWMGNQISGYPSGLVDREGVIDPASATLEANFLVAIEKFAYASIEVMPLIDANDEIEIRVRTKFAVDMDKDMSLAIMIAEDGLKGTSADWNQVNYYSYQSQNLPLVGAGFDWQAEGSSVSGVTYNDVAREALLGATGDNSIIPSSVSENEVVNYNLAKFTWNGDYDKDNSTIVVMLIDDNTSEIINAAESHLKDVVIIEQNGITYYVIDGDTYQLWDGTELVPTGVASIPAVQDLMVYPNPASNNVKLVADGLNNESLIRVYDMTGRMVMQQTGIGVQSSQLNSGVEINVSDLPNGVYNIVIDTESNTMKQTISVVH